MDSSGAEAQKSIILDLPASFEVKVEDVISFSFEDEELEKTAAAHTGAGILLVAKICDALLSWGGCSDGDVRNVTDLTARNLITCESAHVEIEDEMNIDEHSNSRGKGMGVPAKTVESMLKGLLDPNVPRSKHLHINSNEPVLLVNFEQLLHPENRDWVNDVIDTTVLQLQQQWNIWPVRVYAHANPLTPRKIAGGGGATRRGDTLGDAFSITLLNVVNTDIGGPSMPQLLDAPCDAAEWNGYVRREVWRGREVVVREEGEGNWGQQEVAAVDADNASERSFRSENDDDDDKSVGSDALNLVNSKSPRQPDSPEQEDGTAAQHAEVTPKTGAREDTPLLTHLEEDQVRGDMDDGNDNDQDVAQATTQKPPLPQEFEVPERHIKHPTWERHDDGTSLIDLIRSQVSMIVPFGTEDAGHGVGDIETDVAKSRSEKAESSSPSDEEFIVV
ncbi:uncharacterized protein A1O5_01901 [Cladophialophora psammophila CBS 110553]|uniref:DhaK domain-containing protein n=1 Tax=Cladophialophora psammophila CBS 110553 TaxID=1182543 RepID=W9XCZ7_9EURO|nr:uncharacterized protein A1O5_01901 [Cladophialophora psammophila CBS 110553]EXJ75205.1 hypothetical protein A1O5_01901 [Cladophialophora psammophila CBS 110553]